MCVTPDHPDRPDPHTAVTGTSAPVRRPSASEADDTSSPVSEPALQKAKSPINDRVTVARQRSAGGAHQPRMHRPSLLFLAFATVLLGVAIPLSAHAETVRTLALDASVSDLFNHIRAWLMGILAGLATVFLSIGGVRYLMAGSDPGEVEAAKRAFKSAGFGYALAALAPLVVTIFQQIVGT